MSACSGSCSSGWPKALRSRAYDRASARPRRMNETAQTLFHMRVTTSIGSIERVPLQRRADQPRARAVEQQFRGRHLARAELVLEPVDADAVQAAGVVADLDVEHRQALAARRIALRPRQRQRHLRGDRRGEPLAAVQAPAAVAVLHGARLGAADVGAAGGLGHPLAAGPERAPDRARSGAAPRGRSAPGRPMASRQRAAPSVIASGHV